MKAVLASLALVVFTGLASANVTITGTGKIVYVPDLGYIHAGVSNDGKTAEEAWQKTGDAVKKIFDALKKQGLDPKDMKTSGLNVSPKYVNYPYKEPELVGYTVSYDLQITVQKLADMGAILDGLVENGANRNMNISFGCSNIDKLMDEARVKAAAEARKNADLYVTAAGAQLGQVLAITDGSYMPQPILRYDALEAKSGARPLPIAAGQQELTVNVTITFAINQKPLLREPTLKDVVPLELAK
jgi:uncharacterized protein YggE